MERQIPGQITSVITKLPLILPWPLITPAAFKQVSMSSGTPSQGGFLFPLQPLSHWNRQVRNALQHRGWGGSKRDSQGLFLEPLHAAVISEASKWDPFLVMPKSPEISSIHVSGDLRDVVRFNQHTTTSYFQNHSQEKCCASLWEEAHNTSFRPLLHSKDLVRGWLPQTHQLVWSSYFTPILWKKKQTNKKYEKQHTNDKSHIILNIHLNSFILDISSTVCTLF